MKKFLTTTMAVIALAFTNFAQFGSLDTTFNAGTGANSTVITTSIQSDDKVIIGGDFDLYNGTVQNRIARLNVDGTLDSSFDPGSGASDNVFTISIQSDGKIIIGGYFTSYNGTARDRIARLNVDGTLDATFNPGTGANGGVVTTSIQSDGKIIIGGEFTSYNGTARDHIARLNVDGTLDSTFDPGTGTDGNVVYATSIQSDGQLIIGGNFTTYNGTARNNIARLNVDGTLDSSFDPGTGANDIVRTTSIQSDGQLIIGGDFNLYNGTARNRIARLNVDGTLDSSFDPGTGANSLVLTTSIQSDDKIIIGGQFTAYNGAARNKIARLNADGTLDATFNPGTGANADVSTTSIQSDGQLIIGGAFTTYNGTARNRIARLQSITTGINDLNSADGHIKLFPNPTRGALTLQADGLSGTVVGVYNSTGELIIRQNIVSGNSLVLDLSDQASGLYIIEVDQGSYFNRFKVSKQ